MYNTSSTSRLCGDCTDMMMRGPVCVLRETNPDAAQRLASAAETSQYNGCGTADEFSDTPLAIVSSPYQGFGEVYDCPMEALQCGTLFANLYLPIKDANGTRGKGGCTV